jgi:phospholipase/carboxylesterase
MPGSISRRAFMQGGASALSLAMLGACASDTSIAPHVTLGSARLSARPRNRSMPRLGPGLHEIRIGSEDAVIYLPESAFGRGLVPLLTFLHGASRTVIPFVEAHRAAADEQGVAIFAPYSVSETWDGVYGAYDQDVASLDIMLQWLFHHVPVHPASMTLSGFSDGAVYALAVGRANGALFRRIVAYSPHALLETDVQGLPPVLVAHGMTDALVPWGVSAEHIVPRLRAKGHEVEFVSFDGGHSVPLALISETVEKTRALA